MPYNNGENEHNMNSRKLKPKGGEKMGKERLVIEPKRKGDDGYRTFSIRIRQELVDRLESLSAASGHSRNELIGLLL